MRALVFGEPGAGARTQAAVLAERFDVPHLDRSALLGGEPGARPHPTAGAGPSVRPAISDEAAVCLLLPSMAAAADAGGWVLSGFPRTVPQAALLAAVAAGQALDVEVAVRLAVPRPERTDRLVRRGATARPRGARSAHLFDSRVELGPLSGFYQRSARLLTVDGSGTEGQVASDLLRGLHAWLLHRRLSGEGQRRLAASRCWAARSSTEPAMNGRRGTCPSS